ncbi:MAG: bifunctional folylpolyglutamate synthase/dihydrofolate synthase [Firmicutes bacterium]|nr:bifunctional folylpolyglutamate synthase/dihydrofolate synthase [Bacillota bacterium]
MSGVRIDMDYEEAVRYFNDCHLLGSKRGFDNLRKLLKEFDDPQEKLKIIHVAGTNGKGSVCTMIQAILNEQGYKTGLFTSPHLKDYTERIRIGNKDIEKEELADITQRIKNKIEEKFDKDEYFSFFEVITAAAYIYFYENDVDIAVMETGLGGRLDATNVINKPLVSVITSIGIDHTEFLGDTIEKITKEKGGIIKKNSKIVLYSNPKKVYNIIKGICEEKKSKLYYTAENNINIRYDGIDGSIFDVKNELFEYNDIKISMRGQHQIKNCCCALLAVTAFKDDGMKIDEKSIRGGLEKANICARLEKISDKPIIYIDGAHNADGADTANAFMKKLKETEKKKIILITGILKDKNYGYIRDRLTEYADKTIFVKVNNKRSALPEELADGFKGKYEICVNIVEAVQKALKLAENEILFCAGSLYLTGEIREILTRSKK